MARGLYRRAWQKTPNGWGRVCLGCNEFRLVSHFRGTAVRPPNWHPKIRKRMAQVGECFSVEQQGGQELAGLPFRYYSTYCKTCEHRRGAERRKQKADYERDYRKYGSQAEQREWGITKDEMEADHAPGTDSRRGVTLTPYGRGGGR